MELAETLAIALAGAATFALLKFPAGLGSGSVLAVAAAALLGCPVKVPLPLAHLAGEHCAAHGRLARHDGRHLVLSARGPSLGPAVGAARGEPVIVLGAVVGSRFANTSLRMLAGFLGAAFGSSAVSLLVATMFVLVVARFFPFSIANVVIAFAPGAQDTMMVLALALHLDPVYGGAHHLARFFVVTFSMAAAARRGSRTPAARRSDQPGPATRLWTCTMNAMANSGVARLTIGIETKAAMTRPPT